jgi:Transposase DDE domain
MSGFFSAVEAINAEIVMHTHAPQIVREFVQRHLNHMHAARREFLCAAVIAVMSGHLLSLSRLARALMGQGTHKAALKRVDRWMGNRRVAQEAQLIGAALLGRWGAGAQPLVIAVDWSEVAPDGVFVELRAALTRPGMGRGLTVYQQVYPESMLGNATAERALLKQLHEWIPAGAHVIIVSDAGFRRPWFTQIEHCGWSWIGRIRGSICVSHEGSAWQQARAWFAKASHKARRWSNCWLTQEHRFACDMVLYRQRALARKQYGRAGHGSTPRAQDAARAGAREPWLLAHSAELRTFRADEIVAMYGRRMQIEENFRDSKSIPLGMGLEVSQSRTAPRLHALLLIATLAAFLLWHLGQLAEAEGLHLRFKATTRDARELSIITLARFLCASNRLALTDAAITALNQRLGLRA